MSLRQYFTTHTWWGKLIGACLGYLVAGSTGALFGIIIGNFFDRGLSEHFSRPHWSYHAESRKNVQRVFFEATFSVMGHIAKIDGRITEQEIQMAKTLMHEMGLSSEQRKQARGFFNAGKDSNFNLQQMLGLLKKSSHDNPELLKLFIDIQYRAAQVDGLSENKLALMNILLDYFGFAPLQRQYRFYEDFLRGSSTHHQRTHQQSSSQQQSNHTPYYALAHAYAILEISPSASKQDVKSAYRRLMSRNHPDKLIAQGLPEGMIKIANEKTQTIRKAYEEICTSKGW